MAQENQKLKLLHLVRLFREETDPEHGLTMPQILSHLAELGINAERKAIYRDIEALRAFGMDIGTLPRRPVEYTLASREFSLPELLLLADAVQGSRFLTQSKPDALMRSLKGLASKREGKSLSKRVHVEGRVRSQNESVFSNVDCIHEALRERRKVSFKYFKYGPDKKRVLQHDGKPYVETPVQLVYSDGLYYLIAYNDRHEDFVTYRVDRMTSLMITDEPAVRNAAIAAFDVAEHERRAFGMYQGDPVAMTLLVSHDAMSGVIDRFGRDVTTTPAGDGWTRVAATAMESPSLFGWLAQFGAAVVVEKPRSLAESYAAHLRAILDAHGAAAEVADEDAPAPGGGDEGGADPIEAPSRPAPAEADESLCDGGRP
ncbi:MAG: WYL domain-containing protein [Eggerthellaceae bacterium]|nr:WYL domain-containing protein [Eggerthellaceae bacterium]